MRKLKKNPLNLRFWTIIVAGYAAIVLFLTFFSPSAKTPAVLGGKSTAEILAEIEAPQTLPFDTADYAARLLALANATTPAQKKLWPAPASSTTYPLAGAVLPFHRIIAYYGNFLSTQMGVLGEYPEPELFDHLDAELEKWDAADPLTPAVPALQYIAVTAQGYPGPDGLYRLRMPDEEIQKVIDMAAKINALVILDVQVGQSTLQNELPPLAKWLALPQVHLAIDPEFAMQKGQVPGAVYIGSFSAADVNYAVNFLKGIVDEYHLPPKVLVVHRFTEDMVMNVNEIETPSEVQVVMNMDGWGDPSGKLATYQNYIYDEPVEFAGFKLFYKNDVKNGSSMMTPEELLSLTPEPIYIQYQ